MGSNQFSNDFNPAKSNSWFGYSYIGLNVKFPLLLADGKKNKIKHLQLQSQQYSLQLDEKSAQFTQEAATAMVEIERIKNRLNTQETNLILYQESLKISQDRLKEGQITALELNNQEYELQQLFAEYESAKSRCGCLNYLILKHLDN